jgi:hypothetical protein
MKTRDPTRASPKQAAHPPYKHPINAHNEPISMTSTLRKMLRNTGEFKRSDGIRLVHYNGAKSETYVAYRWPSGWVQWYRLRITTMVLTPQSEPTAIDTDDDLPF